MSKIPLHVRLGAELLTRRRASAMSQADLASAVGCSVPTVRLVEVGGGILFNYVAMAALLGVELAGDALPGGAGVGPSLALLRQRRGMSRRTLAETSRVSVPTVASLEAGHDCRMASVGMVAHQLGIVLRVSPTGAPKKFFSGVSKSSAHQAWTTPPDFLEWLYPVVGDRFDLDPCSPTADERDAPVRAAMRYTAADDGLRLAWPGTVFMNPPYNREVGDWVSKARQEVEKGNASVVFGLVAARTDTRWWHDSVASCADTWMLKGRLKFGGTGGNAAPFASALVVWGADDGMRAKVQAAFPAETAWYASAIAGRQ